MAKPKNEMVLRIQYPPDFDGELHVRYTTEELSSASDYNHTKVEFIVTHLKEESAESALLRCAKDIVRTLDKKD